MGLFDDQIKERLQNDNEIFSDAFSEMSSVVMGKKFSADAVNDKTKQTKNAVDDILKYFHIKSQEIPSNVTDLDDVLEFLLRPSGIMRRSVTLSDKWYLNGIGPLLGTLKDGRIIALIPSGFSGYKYFDYLSGESVRITKKNADTVSDEAICFYKPFPLRKLTVKDLLKYFLSTVSAADYIVVVAAAAAVSLIGMLSTYANNVIFGRVIEDKQMSLFIAAIVLLLGVTVSTRLIGIVKQLILSRISTKMNVATEAAAMMRMLSLPAEFFKPFNSGELAEKLSYFKRLCSTITSIVLSGGLTVLFSLVYIFQMVKYARALTVPALVTMAVTAVIFIIVLVKQNKYLNKEMELSAKENGFVFALLSGIQKIKLSGAEKRGFAKWAEIYKEKADYRYNMPVIVQLSTPVITAITMTGTIVIYFFAVKSNISIAEYMAFNVAYSMVAGAVSTLLTMSMNISQIKPAVNQIKPILDAEPEISLGKNVVTRLSGNIELCNVSFRYDENSPNVIDNLSLKIRPGQYVAIVGRTGCGKSTLMRLMLGFEKPHKGAVYYDGKDLNTLDLKSLRKNIGTVMQNGKLFSGDIYSNIVISAPQLSLDAAWEAAEMAGMADSIRSMPMGMHTYITEGGGGISGGQKQRLMIARAIAPKPKILMFDEATSALDNITQKIVSDSLDNLKCTRIVIAHRLSTIKQCDRIIVLDKGKIAEDGTYDELVSKDGVFAELVKRQRIDI